LKHFFDAITLRPHPIHIKATIRHDPRHERLPLDLAALSSTATRRRDTSKESSRENAAD
jgi:hypothetical protein